MESLNALMRCLDARSRRAIRQPVKKSRACRCNEIHTNLDGGREHRASGHWSAAVAAVLFGARRAGRNSERVENMRRTVEVQR